MAETRTPPKAGKPSPKPAPEAAGEPRLTPADLKRENQQTDRLLSFLVVLLAFLLASFPIVDSRFWQSLRTGQLIDAGQFEFGADPYCFTTAGQTWSHPGWLADYFFFRLFEASGGAGMVLFRGVAMILLTLLLFSFQRKASGLITLLTVLAAAMALAPRLWVRPELFSVLFSGLTLHLLARPAEKEPSGWLAPLLRLTGGRGWVFLPPLFALWANLDDWFLLGPLLTFLWWLGGLFESGLPAAEASAAPAERRRLAIVLVVGLAACLLNPYHVRVFKIPGELWSPAMMFLDEKFVSRRISVSPFEADAFSTTVYWIAPGGLTLCEWAYYPLALLGVFSFLVNENYRRGARLASWLGFFLLSAWQTRNIGFFAVVGGGLTLMNLSDWLAVRASRAAEPRVSPGSVLLAMGPRFLVLLFLLAGCFFTVLPPMTEPSFTQLLGEPSLGYLNPRGSVGWSAFADPSMTDVARWRHDRVPLALGQPFHVNFAEPAGYEAWANHGGRCFLDFRYELHGAAAPEYWDAYEALRETGQGDQAALLRRWRQVFQKYDISHIVVPNRNVLRPDPQDPRKKVQVQLNELLFLLTDEKGQRQFELLDFVDGNHFVMAWTGSPHYAQLKERKLAPDRMAFQERRQPPPPSEPPRDLSSPLGQALERPPTRRPTGLDGGDWWLSQFDSDRTRAAMVEGRQAPFDLVLNCAAGCAGQGVLGAFWGRLPTDFFTAANMIALERCSPAQPLLAIDQLRRALAAVPDTSEAALFYRGQAYRRLAACYDGLGDLERRQTRGQPLPLREFQALCAWEAAARLNPGDPDLHESLGFRFLERRGQDGAPEPFLDAGLAHLQEAVRIYRARGVLRGQPAPPERIEEELKRLLDRRLASRRMGKYDDLVRLVETKQAQFQNQSPKPNSGPAGDVALRRVMLAAQLGLLRQMEAELREALALPDPALRRRLLSAATEVYFGLGMLPELIETLRAKETAEAMGPQRFRHVAAMAAAAAGAPAEAAEHRLALAAALKEGAARNLLEAGQLQILGGLAEPAGSSLIGVQRSLSQTSSLSQQISEQLILAGLHLIEAGEPQAAAALFAQALRDVEPNASLAALASRCYFLITGAFLDSAAPKP